MSDPQWWLEAKAMEAAGELKAAEERIRAAVQHIGCASQIAQLYLERMLRLQEQGDLEGAAAAYRESSNWIHSYASMATSGGEGAALSWERDRFLKDLNAAYGGPRE